jgi:DNA (cytosine-5)-methyltransferase 1
VLNGLDLFSGIGGISVALSPWVRPIAYCENDRHAQAVLLSRMRWGGIKTAPIWDDVTTLVQGVLPGDAVDIIIGGFPCQDISCAGNGIGLEGKRSGLFFEIVRLVRELRPPFVFLENVPAITLRGLDRVLLEFSALGYDCRWTIVSAEEIGAPHRRERWFLLAHANGELGRIQSIGQSTSEGPTFACDDGQEESLAHSDGIRGGEGQHQSQIWRWQPDSESGCGHLEDSKCERPQEPRRECGVAESGRQAGDAFSSSWWAVEPDVGRVAHGISARVDRLRGLGNAVVPLQAREAFARLIGIESSQRFGGG